jgi:AraC family transcriptional regulator
MNVEVKHLPEVHVAYMRHVGPYGGTGIPLTWKRLAAWCDSHGLMQSRPTMYGISQDNPETTPPEKCRYDAAVEVDASFTPEGEVDVQTMPGGRYACTMFSGTGADIGSAWRRFITEKLPDGYVPDARPPVEVYEPDFAMDEKTGTFSCWLCMPVRPL